MACNTHPHRHPFHPLHPPSTPPPPPTQCDNVTKQLENLDYHVTMLHGGKTQDQREESIKAGFSLTFIFAYKMWGRHVQFQLQLQDQRKQSVKASGGN